MTQNYTEHYLTTSDDKRIYYRYYKADDNSTVMCSAGLTRNSKDYHELAMILHSKGHSIIVPDMRGRGHSDYDNEGGLTYNIFREAQDIIEILNEKNIETAHFIGTSRGAMQIMGAAALYAARYKKIIMNDLGIKIEKTGLERIVQSQLQPLPNTWNEAIALLQEQYKNKMTLSLDEWKYFAENLYIDSNGTPQKDYDMAIIYALKEFLDSNQDLPVFDEFFKLLVNTPVLLIRGENSDILSMNTVYKMQAMHPTMQFLEVKNRGHVPFLNEPECIDSICNFLK
jgi:pimeloyl-ACP methyl ester carboxylesterase